MSDTNKSIILPTFSGKDEAFQVWWTKFRAFATAKGFVNALIGKEAALPNSESVALDPTTQNDAIKAKERNSLAMAYLLSAFKAEADISLAYETMDDDWPGGLAYKVVEALKDIYQPKDTVTEVELYERLMEVKMKSKEDPKIIFEQVASIANWYNTGTKKIPVEQQIAVVLKAAPKEYMSVLTSEQQKRGTGLKVSHLRAVMNQYYRAVHKKKKSVDDDDEMALAATSTTGGNQRFNQKKKFNGKCNECGKQGHKAVDCWNNPKNASKRPNWFKPNTEIGAAGKDEKQSIELQLVSVSWGEYEEAFEDDSDDEDIEKEINMIQESTATETMLKMGTQVSKETQSLSLVGHRRRHSSMVSHFCVTTDGFPTGTCSRLNEDS